MYFKRIDMHGFKSFAEPVSIEFQGGITCIVGPNGSGKSNISDAIRWVLGEQSPKMLRGGKMEEVIFAGTASRKSRGMAEVTLVIDNTKGMLSIDFSEIAITRRMYRSGESEYFINNNQCRLKDIRELIMDTGIGVDGYSIIGQGKIADIVSSKPETRRQIFEEAAGIVKYRTKKAESAKKLETASGNLDRVNDIINEIESRIDGLKNDSIKATEYLNLRDRYRDLDINITLKTIENIEEKNKDIKAELVESENQITRYKKEKNSIDDNLELYQTRNEELEKALNEIRDKLFSNVEEINNIVNDGQLTKQKLFTIEKDNIRLHEEISLINEKISKEQNSAQDLIVNKQKIDENLKELKEQLELKNDDYTKRNYILNTESKGINDKKNKIYDLHKIINVKNSEINSLLSLKGTLDKRKEQILSEKTTSDSINLEISGKYEEAKAAKDIISQNILTVENEIKVERDIYNKLVLKEKELSKEYEEQRISLGEIITRKKTIEEMESNYEGYNNAVKYVMKSRIPGINGVVAELIKVPSGFEIAIETALGGAMQNIVCEDDKSAQTAIAKLKANKAGRLTFLPIKNIKASSANYDNLLKNAEGFKGIAVQCVSFDSKYSSVMSYLLGRVIIVDKLENAVKLSKKVTSGLRFVTLEGEVINSGGAITGGVLRNNSANLLVRKAEIKKMAYKIEIMQKSQADITKEIEKLRIDISSKLEKLQKRDILHREKEKELLVKENEINLISAQITELRFSEEKWGKELDSITEEENSSKLMIDEINLAIEKTQSELNDITKQIETDTTDYETEKVNLEKINNEITKLTIDVAAEESKKRNIEDIIKRIENYKGELKSEIETKELFLKELQIQKNNLNDNSTNLDNVLKTKEDEKIQLEKTLNDFQEEKTEIIKKINETEYNKKTIDEKLNKFQNQKYDFEIKQVKNETQIDNYKNKLWDEFEISYLQAIEFKKKDFNMSEALKDSKDIKNKIKQLGEVNIGAIKEYESVKERYDFLTAQRNDLLKAMDTLKDIINDMDRTIRSNFKDSFNKIAINFKESFYNLFGGGTAELKLDDETKPLDSNIEIIAQPPGKKLQNINLMSGGEKTMTAISLMFAVLKTKPTPFCILDEVEAALDDANIDRFAKYLTNFKEIQFTLVTHQKATMEYADVLYGVTMPEQGISKIISLKLGDNFEL
ncbi:chromosome segregation protein SMC [Anaerovorax odorimutans]|uniref:chromosome segregation protein SMC n=1 Tax=Anaerovorax odorimutans TaxID=109327 RepID=UPI0003F5FA1F|nr:chromosome segregation protein SMC [Anaerovorax odorimutans]